jgi:hypothetical protein
MLQTFHAAFATENVDLFRDSDFSAPLIADVAFGEISPPVESVAAESTYTFTPADNSGATLLEQDFVLAEGRHNTTFLAGEVGALASFTVVDNLRQLDDSALLRIVQVSINQARVDIYVVFDGVDIADVVPSFAGLPILTTTGYATFNENDYQVYATTVATKDIVAGPVALSLAHGDIVQFAFVDTADPAISDFIKYQHLTVTP